VRTHSKPVSMSVGLGAPRGGRARTYIHFRLQPKGHENSMADFDRRLAVMSVFHTGQIWMTAVKQIE
jgi:hypothetical protein